MTVKSNIIIFRIICIAIIAVAIYNYDINEGFFGFLIVAFTLSIFFSGVYSIRLSETELIFKFQRLIPIWGKLKKIKMDDINSVEFSEGRISTIAILINIIVYVPGTIRSDDEIVIELSNGETYRHSRISSKKQFKKLIKLIKEKIK